LLFHLPEWNEAIRALPQPDRMRALAKTGLARSPLA